jgi:hypothetical protein
MRHFLAYGNSDQASFRDDAVRHCFDFMTVPGTIASYYPDATAAFVLTAEIPYLVDPRTPLFQETIHSPRASHYSLAEWLDIDLSSEVFLSAGRDIAVFGAGFYDDAQVARTVDRLLDLQFNYGGRSASIQAKLDRYRSLMKEALGQDVEQNGNEVRAPEFVVAPYFMSSDSASEWWDVNIRIWDRCVIHQRHEEISPVVAVTDVGFLREAMAGPPDGLSRNRFLWISDFDERRVPTTALQRYAEAIVAADEAHRWTNLYGGFFSMGLSTVGLWGFSNGLGYSESRAWPQLEATGGAPPRYYVPRLHTFMSVANAQLLYEIEPWFFDPVMSARSGSNPIPTLSYHELKRDFAFARRWEVDRVSGAHPGDIATMLEIERQRYAAVEHYLPVGLRTDTGYLERWRSVLAAL